jgi:hypothetical protein
MSERAELGTLSITLNYPAGAFLCKARSPQVRVDGRDVEVHQWGTHHVPVSSGRHRIKVWVPYFLPRKAGMASTDVSVASGDVVELEYMAPALTFARGSIGSPGAQKSTGYSVIRTLNWIVAITVISGAISFLFR